MKNLFDIVNEDSLICEAFKERHIYQAWKSLKDYGLEWSELFHYGNRYKWSDITSDDVQIVDIDDLEAELSNIRRVRSGKADPYIIFAFKDEVLQYVYNPASATLISISKNSTKEWSVDSTRDSTYMSQKGMFNNLADNDYLVKVFISKFGISELLNARSTAQNGRWVLTNNDHNSKHLNQGELGKNAGGRSDYVSWDSYYARCQRMASAAWNKWKEIVAKNKLARETDDNSVHDAVEDILKRLTKFTTTVSKDPNKYNMSPYEFTRIMEMVYDRERLSYGSSRQGNKYTGHYAILYWYNRYCECVMRLSTNDPYYRNSSDMMADRDKYKEIILKQCKEVDEIFKKYGV